MSKILALDASTEGCSVALGIDEDVEMLMEVAPQAHTKLMLPMVDKLLKSKNITLRDLDYIACGKGPGSFTGVRIGVSFAQGLAFGSDLKVIGIGDLEAMSWQAMQDTNLNVALAAIDARMGEVYLGIYANIDGNIKKLSDDVVKKPEEARALILAVLEQHNVTSDIAVIGTGFETYPEIIQGFDAKKANSNLPNAKAILELASQRTSEALEPKNVLPLYVRDTVTWKKVSEQHKN